MANTNSPFGFRQYYGGSGGAPTFAQSTRLIASTDSTAIYSGDPVMPVVSTANGYITQAAPGTTTLAGIFLGCKYLSTSQKRIVWNSYWTGSDATGDVEAYIVDDPNAQFSVMGNSTTFNITGSLTTVTSSTVGQYAQFAIGTGNTASGQSGAYLDSVATTATLPFIVRALIASPPGAPGADPTTAYNQVIVGFNNEWMRSNGAGPTGIS
ncbi:hypothetical protein UFOVP1413_42 [uncultured Caudovirales phage]|uniref:Uncharacterized protein n=1 Tax=uncultured Caudovirales phage TaxID=2100421 RepID=A0A6J5SAE3_9CAUD|nr:hypothetical protein UFOVP893_62 [uncultured Caudovirales phage]CAB4210718.1 hypothetical protein UFOVP1413_42 [uncultured Caudovirales phage]